MTSGSPVIDSAARPVLEREPSSRPARNVALGYLRAFVVVLVLAHHSVLAYLNLPLPVTKSLITQPRMWKAFPIFDRHAQWTGFTLFASFNDTFLMSLMFFISGLFVWSSLRRKGVARFAHDRMIRLGIPFLVATAIVPPIAYYPAYLQTGADGLVGYARTWLSLGEWPSGPMWFIWLLLAFDLAAVAFFAAMPEFGARLGRLCSSARVHPVRFFVVLTGISMAVYVPMTLLYVPLYWTSIGPFQFQTSRLFHYAVYFLAGIGVGEYGIDRGLLAADGILARHWGRWAAWGLGAFSLTVVFAIFQLIHRNAIAPLVAEIVTGAGFEIACGALSFAFLALFVRFANRRRWAYDSLSDNEYAMYLIHYMFVSWVQLAILGLALPAIAKGALVFGVVLLLSWKTSAIIRSIPAVARVV
jgi:Acyltransferase family